MHQRPGQNSRRAIDGNAVITPVLPAGNNEVIGTLEDPFCKTLIEFVKNSNNNHHIRRYWSDDNRYEYFPQWSGWNFDNRISEAVIIDGRHLFWTDARGEKTVTGNAPRYLDLDYLSLYQKKLCYEIYWDAASFGVGNDYSIRIEDLDGNILLASTVFYTSAGGATLTEAQALEAALAAGGYDIETEWCGNKISVCATNAEERVYIQSTGTDIHFTGVNHYPETLIEDYVSLIRMMPRIAPQPRFVSDATLDENKVYGFTFQFRYRYHYWHGAKSKWSPISYVPTNFITDTGLIENSEDYNKIEIDFIDDQFGNAAWKNFVRRVEVAVRYEFTGVWRSVGVFDVADFGVASSEGFVFLNDGNYPVVPSDENSASDVQALGNFDFVPRFARSMEIVQDNNGNHILAVGGNIEQNNTIDCVDVDISSQTTFPVAAPGTAINQTKTRTLFKRGGLYKFYVIYEDRYGRQLPAIYIGDFNPDWIFSTFPRITLNHKPPIDAVRFRIGVSENQNQGAYLQLPSFNINYWKRDNADGSFTFTTYAAGDADYVGFQFVINDIEADTLNFLFKEDNKFFQVETGDRLHVGNSTDDYLVEGYNMTSPSGATSVPSYTVFIAFETGMPNYTLTGGPSSHEVIELYRPSNADSGLAYEIGNPVNIVNPGLSTRNHGSAIDIDDLGDTYNYSKNFVNLLIGTTPTVLVSGLERSTLYDFKQELGPDYGRATAEDYDYKERDSFDQIRHSGIFIPDSDTNGLHSFRGTDYIRVRRDYGAIQSLQYVANVMLAICQFSTQPIYVGKARLLDLSGDTSVGRSDQLFNMANELVSRYGTHNPESIVNTGRYVYAWDGFNGVPWKYSVGGGIDPINQKNVRLFDAIGRDVFPARDIVIGGYEVDYETYYLTFKATAPLTYAFCEWRKGWEGRMPFIPEAYGRIGQRFFSMTGGQAYEHGSGTTMYGIALAPEITIVVNSFPKVIKLFWAVAILGDKFYISDIQVPGTGANVMTSRTTAAKIKKREGKWRVDLPRDGDDPSINPPPGNPLLYVQSLLQGRRLRGYAMQMTLKLDGSSGVLRIVDTKFTTSEETEK